MPPAAPPSPRSAWRRTAAGRTPRRRRTGTTSSAGAKQAEAVNTYVGKGDRIYVAGSLAQNSYEDKDGQRRYRTEVHASEVVFLDSRNGERGADENGHAGAEAVEAQPVATGAGPF